MKLRVNMPENYFPILGTAVPPMLGRGEMLNRVIGSLTKISPSHVSIVGPRYCGKTVFLHRLLEDLSAESSPFSAVDYWDLRHQTPRSNDDFINQLKRHLAEALASGHSEIARFLSDAPDDDYQAFREVVEYASDEGLKILMLWDGFDRPIESGRLDRNLWDQLREIATLSGMCVVTATRKPLHELLRSKDDATSDFWGIFEAKLELDCFDEKDRDAIVDSVPNLEFDKGARSELDNWTAAYPPLLLSVLNKSIETTSKETVDSATVRSAAEAVDEVAINIVRDLWDECSAHEQDLFRSIEAEGSVLANSVPRQLIGTLCERGFIRKSGNKYQPSCGLLTNYIATSGANAGLGHLFGDWGSYRRNIRRMLEHRLAQSACLDDSLVRLVSKGIEDIPDYPEHCLNNLSHIEEEALDAILSIEFGKDRIFDQGCWDTLNWTDSSNPTVRDLKVYADKRIPNDRLLQLRLLRLITGSHPKFAKQSKFVTKDIYVLVDAIHTFRNRTQHAEGEKMGLGVAVSALMLCVELLACLGDCQARAIEKSHEVGDTDSGA
jgi:hypothetical protein